MLTERNRTPRVVLFYHANAHFCQSAGFAFEFERVRHSIFRGQAVAMKLGNPGDFAHLVDLNFQSFSVSRSRVVDNFSRDVADLVALNFPMMVAAFRELFHGKSAVGNHILAEGNCLACPGGFQSVGRLVFLFQPVVPDLSEIGRVRFRELVQLSARPGAENAVFVVDLDHRNAGIVNVGFFRVRIEVRQQIFGVLFLIFDHLRLEVVQTFVVLRNVVVVVHAVALVKLTPNVEVYVDINAVAFQLINQIVELFHLRFRQIKVIFAVVPAPDNVRIHVMKPNGIDPKPG